MKDRCRSRRGYLSVVLAAGVALALVGLLGPGAASAQDCSGTR